MEYSAVNYSQEKQPSCVVGIGASAGGLEALQQFLTFLPKDTGMAFVIIQHLSPDHKSLLVDILEKYTSLPIAEVEDDMQVRRNHIYILPPKYNVEITSDILHLKTYDHSRINHPIDVFLRSLAESYENRAVAVILSGTGSDGTNGIRDIKEQNGVIIVQNPDSAKFDGMPKNAISTGFVDLILNPEAIAREMMHISNSINASNGKLMLTDGDLLGQVFSILRDATDTNYTYYKQTTILRRIERRIVVTHNRNLKSYVEYLRENPFEAKTLAKEVLIGVTSFFRDPEYFEVLKNRVITQILREAGDSGQIRVWVAGCSTGEEAYSVAMLFAEVCEELGFTKEIKIFATDLDADSVQFASRGIYGENIIEDVSVNRLSRFFTRRGSKYIVNHEIRKMIVFAQHNVFQDPPFGRLDLVCCRNLLIYFQSILQKNLFSIFHVALRDGGYLFLGKSEAVGEYSNVFRPLCPNEKIFIHNASAKTPAHANIPFSMHSIDNSLNQTTQIRQSQDPDSAYREHELNVSVLEALLPACVLVDENNSLKHIYGDCTQFLAVPAGSATLDIFLLIRSDLKTACSTILKESRDKDDKVSFDMVPVKLGSEPETITITAQPIRDRHGMPTGLTAIAFIRGNEQSSDAPVHYNTDTAAARRISDLENELRVAQDHLRQTVVELESVNAELQAANEELLTSNEELQSSNEELQSVNEELYTVNSEYQSKVTEFASVNNDMANFLSSTLVGIIMVDRKLCIRKFTEYISSEFSMVEQDIGRPLQYITFNFASVNLIELSNKVLETAEPLECQTTSVGGKTYLIRIAPYRTMEDKMNEPADARETTPSNIQGLVLTFIDTTRQSSDERQLAEMTEALRIAAKTSQEKENFLSHMSHDMRTPLTAIIGLLELSMDEKDPAVIRTNLEKMSASSNYLLHLIEEVLETSKLDAGKVVSTSEVTLEEDFFDLVNPIIEERAKDADITYRFTLTGSENKAVLMDTDHVARVLVNLLGNAVKFTKPGGLVELIADAHYLQDDTVHYTYQIKDNGCGISREFMNRMYLPFEQDDATRSPNREGTGLGLFISKRLVDLLGGTISCASELGEGTTFIVDFDFPIASEEQIYLNCRKEAVPDLTGLEGKRVLIAEDNSLNADVLKSILETHRILVDIAENGKVAVERVQKEGDGFYDAILMDLRMPVMDGLEAAEEIRRIGTKYALSVPIFSLSADVYENIEDKCRAAGINACLKKPLNSKELFAALARALQKAPDDSEAGA
ncbi:MAG: response regulator [Lachnospiraceae bacterium]|nr:response regulator [Lachnospiraceae bacterium]